MAPVTKSRVSLSIEQKRCLLKEVSERCLSKTEIAKKYKIPKSTLSSILKVKERILQPASAVCLAPDRKRSREAKYPHLEEALTQWMRKVRGQNIPIDGNLLKEKADFFGLRLGVTDFKCSDGWLQKFKKRHGLSFNKLCGESASVDKEAVKEWKENKLKELLTEYKPEDVFNADETGLMYQLLPDRTLTFKDESCSGGKRSKNRITVMMAANMMGTEKLPLLIIGKAQKPRCFKGVPKLPTAYKANKKAWMTSAIYEEWLRKLDLDFCKKKRKVLLVVDNCTAHGNVDKLEAIRVEFLPPNVTSVLQPLDQGVIQAFKKHYRRMLLRRIVLNLEHGKEYSVTLLAAIHLSCAAWNAVTAETIANCFRHAGFSKEAAIENEQAGSNEEDEALLQALRDKNVAVPENVTFSQYANWDCNLVCIDEMSDDDILAQVKSQETGETSDDDEDVHCETKPSSQEAAAAAEVLRRFFQDGDTSIMNAITDLEGHIFKCTKRKQSKITSFFDKQ